SIAVSMRLILWSSNEDGQANGYSTPEWAERADSRLRQEPKTQPGSFDKFHSADEPTKVGMLFRSGSTFQKCCRAQSHCCASPRDFKRKCSQSGPGVYFCHDLE